MHMVISSLAGAALSGWSACSNDIGGFKGPMPDAELLVRWIQSGIAQPRFCIHSWNDGNTCTELWSHPEVLPVVRAAVNFRYHLLPYLYHLSLRNHETGQPICRPLVLEFPTDVNLRQGRDTASHQVSSNDWMLGSSLLVCPVTQPQALERAVYLPGDRPWFSWQTGDWHSPGDWITLRNTLQEPAPILLMRQGTGVPLLAAITGHSTVSIAQSPKGGGRVVLVAPGPDSMTVQWYEDDGVTPTAQATRWQVTVTVQSPQVDGTRVVHGRATCVAQGSVPFDLPFDAVTVVGALDLPLEGGKPVDSAALVAAMWPKAGVQTTVPLAFD